MFVLSMEFIQKKELKTRLIYIIFLQNYTSQILKMT